MTSLVDEVLGDIALWEGVVAHPYLDTKGFVTVGIGHLLATPEACAALPFGNVLAKRPATTLEKRAGWALVKARPPGLLESSYASASPLRLTRDACFDLARARLEGEFLPGLRAKLPGFDAFPRGVQRAIVDVSWNYGLAGLFRTHTLFPQLLAGDWESAAKTCVHLSSRPLRNEWRATRFRDAA